MHFHKLLRYSVRLELRCRQPVVLTKFRYYCTDEDTDPKMRTGAFTYRKPLDALKQTAVYKMNPHKQFMPRESEIVIVGGGLVGSAAAYFLRTKYLTKWCEISVIERDPCYTRAASLLSAGGIRHQFSVPENVQMSMFTTEFLRNIRSHLSLLDQDPPDVQFNHHGYLFLSPPEKAEKLEGLVKMQRELGAEIEMCSKEMLRQRFPWLNLDGIECGSLGLEGEGWFDPQTLLNALKMKNQSLDVNYIQGEVVGFSKGEGEHSYDIKSVTVKDEKGDLYEMNCAFVINCSGPWAGYVSAMAGIGIGEKSLEIRLPVEPRKRFVYVFHCPNGPGLSSPLLVDITGTYFRRDGLGGTYICGASPESEEDEPSTDNLDVDYDFFNNKLWHTLAHRVPAFENIKLKSAWAGFYDFNYFDQNLIIGKHPNVRNFYFANGMSGHGLQQSIAIGRALSEIMVDGEYSTIDLSRFSFDRVILQDPLYEDFIV